MPDELLMVALVAAFVLPALLLMGWDFVTSDVKCGSCGHRQRVLAIGKRFACKRCKTRGIR